MNPRRVGPTPTTDHYWGMDHIPQRCFEPASFDDRVLLAVSWIEYQAERWHWLTDSTVLSAAENFTTSTFGAAQVSPSDPVWDDADYRALRDRLFELLCEPDDDPDADGTDHPGGW